MRSAKPRTPTADAEPIHGTCVVLGTRGVLIRGCSGSGKSDLALRLIAEGARLIADDQVLVRAEAGRVVARAPESIRGLLEVRGVGLVPAPTSRSAVVRLVVDLAAPHAVPRLPEPRSACIAGIDLPLATLAPFEASAAIKVRLALRFGAGSIGAKSSARTKRVSRP